MSLIDQAKEQMAKTVENTKENFSGIRTGRANPALLNGITVDYYGAPTPIKAVASIGVPEPRTLSVTPFDASQAGAVEKALRNSDLGISPNRDGNVIRLTMPELTEDRRKEYVKLAKGKAEDGKVAVRNIRRKSKEPTRSILCWRPSRRRSWRSDSDQVRRIMERNEQLHEEAEETLDQINKKTGRNMPQAIATGAALVILIVACLLLSVDLFVLLVVMFMILALWELRVDFATVGLHLPVFMLWLCSSFTLIATYYSPYHLITMSLSIIVSIILVAIAASAKISVGNRLSLAVAGKLSNTDASARLESSFNHEGGEQHHSRLSHVAVSVLTVLYIPLLASCVIISLTFNGHPIAHAIMLVFLPALSDTGGLFAGAWLGKHKLSPRISPKKSVEGLVGSMLFAMAGAFAVFACTYDASKWATRWWVPIVAGILIGAVGTFGDLCASMLKRDIGIKDMGHLLKGHGGVMDRVDSILMSAPFACALLWITGL